MSTMTITGPKIRSRLPGPNARRILEADERLISPSYTRPYPWSSSAGEGTIVEDVDGNDSWISPQASPWSPPAIAIPSGAGHPAAGGKRSTCRAPISITRTG